MSDILKITPYETDKSKIKTTQFMDDHIIPKHPVSVMVCGKSGMGKTQFLLNLLKKKEFYKDYFDLIFLFSETAGDNCDDLYEKNCDIPPEHMFKPDKDGLNQINHIISTQKKIIKEQGINNSPKILVIFDDIAHSKKFLDSRPYLLLHIANRHFNISCFSLVQSYVKIPRSCRCQIGALIFFHGATNSEKKKLSEEHCPANYSEKEFMKIIDHAIDEKYNFLFINKRDVMKKRYRKNLDKILELSK
jgi:hypothetical protein